MAVRIPETRGDGAVRALDDIGVLRDRDILSGRDDDPGAREDGAVLDGVRVRSDVDAYIANGEGSFGEDKFGMGVVEWPDEEEIGGEDEEDDGDLQFKKET